MTIQPHTEGIAESVDVDSNKVLAYLGLNPGDPKAQAVVAVAQRYHLDPLLKHVIVIPKGGAYITRDGLLHVAHRSGQLDGIVVDQEPKLSKDGKEWMARVSVYRKDMGHPFTFPGRYPVNGSNREYAQEMALKAAEAHALRRAFDVTGLPIADEQRPAGQPQPGGGLGRVLSDDPKQGDAKQGDDWPEADLPTPTAFEPDVGEEREMFDYRSGWARSRFFPALRVCEDADPTFNPLEFMSEIVGRPVTLSKELLAVEANLVYDNLPTRPDDDTDDDGDVADGEVVEEELPFHEDPA